MTKRTQTFIALGAVLVVSSLLAGVAYLFSDHDTSFAIVIGLGGLVGGATSWLVQRGVDLSPL